MWFRVAEVLPFVFSFHQREKRMRIYSLFDRKLKEYGPLVLSNNDEACKRALLDGVPSSGSTVAKYPEDFDLMLLGEFDPESGILVPEKVPFLVENVAVVLTPRQTLAEGVPDAG